MNEYKHIPREKRLKEIIIGQSIVALIIVVASLSLVFYGFGYEIDWKNFSIKHTGIIYLSFQPKDADVYIENEKKSESSPFDANLLPGHYNVSIRHDGYHSWNSSIVIEADKVLSIKNVVLFMENPKISQVTEESEINAINTPYDTLVKNPQGDLTSNSYEIWVGNDLVTRYSAPILNVIWYPGREYIAYQQGSAIRIINRNGTNDVKLVDLPDNLTSKFIFSWDGAYLLYKDSEGYKKAKII
jgi:hypothetical protein